MHPSDLPAVLADFDRPWFVAGGWAIEFGLPTAPRRDHEDIDVTVFFDDQHALRDALADWDLWIARDGALVPWPAGEPVALPDHELWGRRTPDAPWTLEVLFEQRRGDQWVFRRDDRITRPLDDYGRIAANGLPIVAPEVQLLYKSKGRRPKDVVDFDAAVPLLDQAACAWLASALELIDAGHPWLPALSERRRRP